jgi:hypothetical protein
LGEPIDFDDDGQCVLEFDGGTELVLACAASTGMLSVRAPLLSHPSQVTSATLREALLLNYGELPSGVWVAQDAADGQLVLLAMVDPEVMSPSRFLDLLADLVALVPQARARLAQPEAHVGDAAWMTGERP